MAKKTKKKSSNHINDEITDERFIAAATRPQFQKAKRGSSHHQNKSSTTSTAAKSKSSKLDDDDSGGALISTTSNHDTSGLGVSLTQAIQSDDRFAAALNSDKFGCVPSRDKYGRKVKKKKKKKKEEECNNRDDVEESDVESVEDTNKEEEEVGKKSKKNKSHKDNNDEDDSDNEGIEQGNNSMEARIAYLNALSRGDISASSSSESDSEEDSDDNSDDDDDDSSTSSTNVRGKSGVFDPNYKSLPGEAQYNSDEEEEELTHEPSPHLCILNLNWEHVRAVDVYAMLHSFCPPGTLKHVEVYPSDFGKERMEKERMEGPGFAGLWKKDKKSKEQKSDGENRGEESDEEEDDSGSDSEQLSNSDDDDEDASDSNDEDGSEDEEDVLNLAEATSKLYAHFPPQSTVMKNSQLTTQDEEEEGFDIEKLREYEASKLRYYFAIATFSTPQAAEVVYENVDGMEMENSASEIDVRVLPTSQYSSTIEGRELRDNCNALPAKYVPPENVVTTALRQSRVTCSWETGDADRERKLTKYGMGKDAWEALAEGDDIKFYLATSDNSSASESDDDDEEEEVNETEATKSKTKKKGSNMRAMLGLAGSDSEEEEENEDESRQILMDDQSISEDSSSGSDSDGSSKDNNKQQSKKKLVSTESESESDEDEAKNKNSTKQVTFTPGKHNLEQKIRSKLQSKQSNINGELLGSDDDGEEKLSPYQKYLEKRKEKRRERRQAARGARKGKNDVNEDSDNDNMNQDDDNDGMYGVDPEFGIAQFSDEESNSEVAGGEDDSREVDGFFLGKKTSSSSKSKNGKAEKQKKMEGKGTYSNNKIASTKEELELLVAGDDDEEHVKDYDMRGLTKLERHANKKLKGKRKRQLETLASNVSGQDFHIDTTDDRFSALLDGGDDRFGIDRTNPAYKETGAMKELLQEQSKRRKKKRNSKEIDVKSNSTKKNDGITEHRNENSWKESSSGAMALSSLVQSLQQKVSSKGSSRKKNSQ